MIARHETQIERTDVWAALAAPLPTGVISWRQDGRRTAHLVFFDRHGWYCEHGRTCPAVGHAKKHNGQIARVS